EFVRDHFERGAAARRQRNIESDDLGHAADTNPVVETRDGYLVSLIQDGGYRSGARVDDRQSQRVSLHGIHWEIQTEGSQEAARMASASDDVGIGGQELLLHSHARDPTPFRLDAVDLPLEQERHAERFRRRRKLPSEQMTVARLVVGQT